MIDFNVCCRLIVKHETKMSTVVLKSVLIFHVRMTLSDNNVSAVGSLQLIKGYCNAIYYHCHASVASLSRYLVSLKY